MDQAYATEAPTEPLLVLWRILSIVLRGRDSPPPDRSLNFCEAAHPVQWSDYLDSQGWCGPILGTCSMYEVGYHLVGSPDCCLGLWLVWIVILVSVQITVMIWKLVWSILILSITGIPITAFLLLPWLLPWLPLSQLPALPTTRLLFNWALLHLAFMALHSANQEFIWFSQAMTFSMASE